MQRYIESDTPSMHSKTIEKVIKAMHSTMKQSGYSDETLKKIQNLWKENLKKDPRSKFAHITPFKLQPVKPLVPEVKIKPPSPIIIKPATPPKIDSDSDEVYNEEDDEPDPLLAKFEELKRIKQEEIDKSKEVKAEIQESESDDELQASDDETKLDCPEATGIMHCLHDSVKRKGNYWTISIKACVYQEAGRGEVFFRTAQSKFHFIDPKK